MSGGFLAAPGKWHRYGRGLTSEVGFLAPDALDSAIRALPAEGSPYQLVAVTSMKQDRHYVEMAGLTDLDQLDEKAADGEWLYFLWSPSLTPGLAGLLESGYTDPRVTDVLALNGLVNIQYQRQLKERQVPTRIGCVHKICSDEGELIVHGEYEKVYRSLLRSLRKARA